MEATLQGAARKKKIIEKPKVQRNGIRENPQEKPKTRKREQNADSKFFVGLRCDDGCELRQPGRPPFRQAAAARAARDRPEYTSDLHVRVLGVRACENITLEIPSSAL